MINEEQKVIRPFMERPFEYLKPSSEDILHYWYQAREYVLNYLITSIKPYKDANTFPDKWNFVVDGDNDLMLSVVRHLALYAHFLNYKEFDRYGNLLCGNRTVITIISKKTTNDIREKLESHDFLGNLPKYCKTTIFGEIENRSSYIDIEIEVVRDRVQPVPDQLPVITKDLVLKYIDSIQSAETIRINTLKAICTSKAYDLGDTVNNLPYEDINSVHRYFNALNIFRKKILKFKNSDTLVKDDEWKNDSFKFGTYSWANGNLFLGNFNNDSIEGMGTFYSAALGTIETGLWKNGKRIDINHKDNIPSTRYLSFL